ncbi:uncharacterized protein LOC143279395 [Babylonia areolata]|uniref:uncharacterized protein LOC143279395 n=1 Tax=Babylonia areolata TaxID=304850 RepID=UPI003FD05703
MGSHMPVRAALTVQTSTRAIAPTVRPRWFWTKTTVTRVDVQGATTTPWVADTVSTRVARAHPGCTVPVPACAASARGRGTWALTSSPATCRRSSVTRPPPPASTSGGLWALKASARSPRFPSRCCAATRAAA